MNSTLTIRDLATRAAGHPNIERAVNQALRSELPGVIEGILRDMYPGETLRLYVPKRSVSLRGERNRLIVQEFNGRNAKALAIKYGLTPRMVYNVVKAGR
jgi:Mor family transcriptional regulator